MYISEIANYLHSQKIAVHIGNQGTSALAGSGSYQQSVYVLFDEQYEEAVKLLKEGGYWNGEGDNASVGTNPGNDKQWAVFLVALAAGLLSALVVFL